MIQLIVLNPKFVAKVLQIFGIYKDLTVKNKMHLNFYWESLVIRTTVRT